MRGIENWGAAILLVAVFALMTAVVLRIAYQAHPVVFVAAAAFLAVNYTHYTRKALAP